MSETRLNFPTLNHGETLVQYRQQVRFYRLGTGAQWSALAPKVLLQGVRPSFPRVFAAACLLPDAVWTQEQDAQFEHRDLEIRDAVRTKSIEERLWGFLETTLTEIPEDEQARAKLQLFERKANDGIRHAVQRFEKLLSELRLTGTISDRDAATSLHTGLALPVAQDISLRGLYSFNAPESSVDRLISVLKQLFRAEDGLSKSEIAALYGDGQKKGNSKGQKGREKGQQKGQGKQRNDQRNIAKKGGNDWGNNWSGNWNSNKNNWSGEWGSSGWGSGNWSSDWQQGNRNNKQKNNKGKQGGNQKGKGNNKNNQKSRSSNWAEGDSDGDNTALSAEAK